VEGLRDQRLVQRNLDLRISGLLCRSERPETGSKEPGSEDLRVCCGESERPETGSKEPGSENLRSLSKV